MPMKKKVFCLLLCAAVLTMMAMMSRTNSAIGQESQPEWNCWKGPNYDGKSLDTGLLDSWPEGGPKLLWQAEGLGIGYANLTFWKDKIFTVGDFDDVSYLLYLNRADGKIVKKIELGKGGKIGGHDGPKSTVPTDGKYVFAENQNGFLLCAEVETGNVVWRKNLYTDFDGRMPSNDRFGGIHWGYASSPLIDGETLVCMPGGPKGTLVALNKATGEPIWYSSELTDSSPYTSVLPTEIDGVRQYLVLTEHTIAGINPEDGKLLWRAPFPGKSIVCTDPLYYENIVFATCAYNVGSYGYSVKKIGDSFSAKQKFELKKIDNKHHNLMRVGDYVYSSTDRGSFACIEFKTGKIQWEERKMRGKSSVSFADGKLILRKENTGELILVDPSPKKYKEISRFEQPERSAKNAWTYPLVVDKKMYVRDQDKLFCYDLAK